VAEALGGAAEGSYEQEAAVVEEDEDVEREDERGWRRLRRRMEMKTVGEYGSAVRGSHDDEERRCDHACNGSATSARTTSAAHATPHSRQSCLLASALAAKLNARRQ
jgi:hypothetical protein